MHGAIDYDIPLMTPVQESATIFLSLNQQVIPPLNDRKQSLNSNEKDLSQMTTAIQTAPNKKQHNPPHRKMTVEDEDLVNLRQPSNSYYLVLDQSTGKLKDYIEAESAPMMQGLTQHLKTNSLQMLTYLNIEGPQQLAFRVLDDTGIALQLQMNL